MFSGSRDEAAASEAFPPDEVPFRSRRAPPSVAWRRRVSALCVAAISKVLGSTVCSPVRAKPLAPEPLRHGLAGRGGGGEKPAHREARRAMARLPRHTVPPRRWLGSAGGEVSKNFYANEGRRCTQSTRMGLSAAWSFRVNSDRPHPRGAAPMWWRVFPVRACALSRCWPRCAQHAAARTSCTNSGRRFGKTPGGGHHPMHQFTCLLGAARRLTGRILRRWWDSLGIGLFVIFT